MVVVAVVALDRKEALSDLLWDEARVAAKLPQPQYDGKEEGVVVVRFFLDHFCDDLPSFSGQLLVLRSLSLIQVDLDNVYLNGKGGISYP